MAKIKIALRIQPEYKAMLGRFKNPSGTARAFIVAGLLKADYPREKEVEQLTMLREELRRVGVNLNQIAKAFNQGKTVSGLETEIHRLSKIREKIVRVLRSYYG